MHQIVLPKFRHIHKTVSITVVLRLAVLEMKQCPCGKAVVEMYASVKVHLLLQVGVKICVGTKSVCSLRFQKFDVYLSRNALISVLHTRCTLAHLYRLHPRSGDIAEGIRQ